jgi:hypothetical protein
MKAMIDLFGLQKCAVSGFDLFIISSSKDRNHVLYER